MSPRCVNALKHCQNLPDRMRICRRCGSSHGIHRWLSEGLADRFPERSLIGRAQLAELTDNEGTFKGGEDRLYSGRPYEAGSLPSIDPDLANSKAGRSWLVTAITTTSGFVLL